MFALDQMKYAIYRVIHKIGSKSQDTLFSLSLLLSVCMFTWVHVLCIDVINFIDITSFVWKDNVKHTRYGHTSVSN